MTIWKTLPSNTSYEVSNDGRVRNKNTMYELSIKPHIYYGYLCVKLWKNGKIDGRYLHRIVCEAFHGKAPKGKTDVAHSDGKKGNNNPCNLRWVTKSENEKDKIYHGRSNHGERNGMAKISNKDVLRIIKVCQSLPRSSGGKRIKKGSLDYIAKKYGVTKCAIQNILSGRRRIHG